MIDKFLAKISSRERTALIIAAVIFSIMFLDRLVLGPILGSMKTLDVTTEEKTTLLKTNLRILSNKEKILKEIDLYKKYSLKSLPVEDEWAGLLKEVENLALSSEVELIDVSPSGTRKDGLLRIYLVKVDCEGSTSNIIKFMHSIEISKKLLKIQSIRLKPVELGSEIMECDLSVSKIVMPE